MLVTVLGLAACGLPDEGRTQVVDDASVPYELLDAGESPTRPDVDAPTVPRHAPMVFWTRADRVLVPAAVDLSCAQTTIDVVRGLLEALASSPRDSDRDARLGSAIPPAAQLTLVGVDDRTAEVELDPLAIGDAERLPLAVGQVVLSVTSAPGVDAVRFVTSGETVDLPLPGGALATGSATAEDYATLLPDRLAADGIDGVGLGCDTPDP
ncbi:GerMN domain-containing protein [Nocardioides sp.]|uniref:GerMN domain-containing protein n=1 Tax=Nocardioides sp. TaxID=35761 RepID=UPI0035B09295